MQAEHEVKLRIEADCLQVDYSVYSEYQPINISGFAPDMTVVSYCLVVSHSLSVAVGQELLGNEHNRINNECTMFQRSRNSFL